MTHIPRIHYHGKLEAGKEVELNETASIHLIRVLRLQDNHEIRLFNGDGNEYQAVLRVYSKKNVKALIEKQIACGTESKLNIHLLQAISRGEKMDFTIQKATELGVQTITPLFTEHGNVKLPSERLEKRLEHWQMVAANAAEQSGRCSVPQIKPVQNFAGWISQRKNVSAQYLKIVLAPSAANSLVGLIKDHEQSVQNIILLAGPEGGLSKAEIDLAEAAGFFPAHLGPRILRTETAALVAVSILQAISGDFKDSRLP